jgi:hypothetical protein
VIPRASWRAIKDRLGRRQAFIATTVDRAAIRTVIRNAHRHYAIARAGDVLPISTMQWSSVMMHHDGSHIALVDVEQANAVSFLFARMAWLEHPIFSYIEFMIRAAETFYDDGWPPRSLNAPMIASGPIAAITRPKPGSCVRSRSTSCCRRS